MALRFPARYGFAGVLSGYFKPFNNQLEFPLRQVSPFGGNRKLAGQNTPLDEMRKLRLGTPIPQFWLGAGTGSKSDVASAEVFWQELSLRQASVPLILTKGGGHDMTTWRAEVAGHAGLDDTPAGPGRRGRGGCPLAAAAAVRLSRGAAQAAPPAGQEPSAGRPAGRRPALQLSDLTRQHARVGQARGFAPGAGRLTSTVRPPERPGQIGRYPRCLLQPPPCTIPRWPSPRC